MTVEFSKSQFETLLKLIYLAHWMANGVKIADDRLVSVDDLEQYVYACAQQNGLSDWVEYDDLAKLFLASQSLEENIEIQQIKDEYNEEIFWSELIQRLAARDFINRYGEEALVKMNATEQKEKKSDLLKKYAKEFEENGIENLNV